MSGDTCAKCGKVFACDDTLVVTGGEMYCEDCAQHIVYNDDAEEVLASDVGID